MKRHGIRQPIIWMAAVWISALTAAATFAQDYASYVVTIDSTSTNPIGTGFIPASAGGEILVIAEGNVQTLENSSRFDRGWAGPTGSVRLARVGQPIGNGMPYGALVGGFSADIGTYRYLGRIGAAHLQPANVGRELRLALNASAADLASMSGQVTATVIYLADGYPDVARIPIADGATLPIATGLTASAGDRFAVLPFGTIQTNAQPGLMDGYFGPEGLPKFNRAGQPYPEGPYGGIYGYFSDPAGAFYIGDGGTWEVDPSDVGLELFIDLNLDDVDLAGCDGRFVVNVVRIPQ